jgi:2-oxoglutarate dehydrogenase E2 component (dihydrolipoamide succinyltransferase)
MKVEVRVPSFGESISQVTIGTIFKPSGSYVEIDDELLEMESDKVNQVLYASTSGVLSLFVQPGDTVAIGHLIGAIEEQEQKPVIEHAAAAAPPPPVQKEEAPVFETRKKMSTVRRSIADRLLASQKEMVTVTTFNEADMSEVIKIREQYKELFITKHGVKLGFMSFFVKASVFALQQFPQINAYLQGEEIILRSTFDIAIAVSTEKGVIVPVIKNCDHLSFAQIEKAVDSYASAAKEGKLSLDDLRGGGFTITNGGVFGSLFSTPVINPPQCAILGMHKIEKRPYVVKDEVAIRPLMYLALSYDHRLVDGKDAVLFLVTIKECIEDPHRLEIGV